MADRVEREIEEILRKLDNFVPSKPRRTPRHVGQPFAAAQSWFAHRLARISLQQVMMWSLLAVILTFLLRGIPGAYLLMVFALIVFVTAFILSARGGHAGPAAEKRWRGQPMELHGPSWPNRIKAWVKGRKPR